jgi:hypothetical protein
MNHLPTDQLVLLVAQTTALVALCLRVWWIGLVRTYASFFVYLLLALLQTGILHFVPFDPRHSAYAWMATEGLIVCAYALMVLESSTIILRDLPGIASRSRSYITACLGVAMLVSVLLLALEKTPTGITLTFLLFERVIASSLVCLILLVVAFLAYYPVPLSRNAIVYSIGYAVYFLAKATALFIANYSHQQWYDRMSTFLLTVSTACLIFWIFALTRKGEAKTVVIGHQWNSDDEQRLLAQLQAYNDSILRTARK